MAYTDKDKEKAKRKAHYTSNKERILEQQAKYDAVNIDKKVAHKRLRLSGVSQTQYDSAYLVQKGVCAICSKTNHKGYDLAADHCHTTGIFRGLLCNPCNLNFERINLQHPLAEKAFDYMLAASLRQQA